MYGKRRIILRQNGEVVLAGKRSKDSTGGSWMPVGFWNHEQYLRQISPSLYEYAYEAQLLKDEFIYRRPTKPHMFDVATAKTKKELKEAINKKYKWMS